MNTKSMVWKEWRQNRTLFFYMLAVCLTLAFAPTIMDSLRSGHPTGFLEAPVNVVLFVGPFLALIAGISALGREQGRVEAFWRSRPIRLHTWLLAKYGVGLGIVLGVCVLLLLVDVGFIFLMPVLRLLSMSVMNVMDLYDPTVVAIRLKAISHQEKRCPPKKKSLVVFCCLANHVPTARITTK